MECSACGIGGNSMMRCSRCRLAFYCSPECQRKDWLEHRKACITDQQTDPGIPVTYIDDSGRTITETLKLTLSDAEARVTIKHNNRRDKLLLSAKWPCDQILKLLSSKTNMAINAMKFIHKGKVIDSAAIPSCIEDRTVLLVLGEKAVSADGLEERAIQCIMQQVGVDRGRAIKGLRSNTTVLDAILYLGN